MAKNRPAVDPPNFDLPKIFLERLRKIVAAEARDGIVQALSRPRCVGFRVNSLRASVRDVLAELLAVGLKPNSVDWSPVSFWLPAEHREHLTYSPMVSDGKIYIQGLSSQLASVLLDPQPGETVLDLAAAPGGKTTHLAALMENRGMISAVEPIRDRFFRLRGTLARNGVTIAKTYQKDGRLVGEKTGPRFDRVLLDAPCSAEARLRLDDPESFRFWSPRKIRESARKQRGLIESAFNALKPGGRLLYCTCTFAPEENEQIVADLLGKFPDAAKLERVSLSLPNLQPGIPSFGDTQFPAEVSNSVRILPTESMDAFFCVLIRKHV